jgi:hypothetical protein
VPGSGPALKAHFSRTDVFLRAIFLKGIREGNIFSIQRIGGIKAITRKRQIHSALPSDHKNSRIKEKTTKP